MVSRAKLGTEYMKRTLAAVALIAGLASGAGAQIIRPVTVYRHSAYMSLSAGWQRTQSICDPESKACWTFGEAPQYRASIELPLSQVTTIGISYANAQVPLRWADTPPNTANCTACDANGEVNQILGVLHLGGTGAFQQLIDISAGATQFGNFKTTTGTPLGTGKRVTDFSFALGFGMGFRMTESLLFTLQQEYGVVVHKRVPGAANSSAQQQTLRLGLRLGL
jgi:opacity protein-like surface antigen